MKTYLTESESLELFGPETEKERHELNIKQTLYTLEQLRDEEKPCTNNKLNLCAAYRY